MGEPRGEIPRGVDRVAGRAAQRQADARRPGCPPNTDRGRCRARCTCSRCPARPSAARPSRSLRKAGCPACGGSPASVQKMPSLPSGLSVAAQWGKYASHTSTAPRNAPRNWPARYVGTTLGRDVPHRRQPEGDRGVDVCAAGPAGDVDGDRHAESPAGRDDDPAGVLALRLRQHDVGHHSVTQKDEDHRADQLADEDVHVVVFSSLAGRTFWSAAIYRRLSRQNLPSTLRVASGSLEEAAMNRRTPKASASVSPAEQSTRPDVVGQWLRDALTQPRHCRASRQWHSPCPAGSTRRSRRPEPPGPRREAVPRGSRPRGARRTCR